MGTLTADCPRLESQCPHKLATSCRLTSTPNCCACADERPQLRLYRVYIDGVGFVQRGTRWQSYCWFCKEFWNNRLAATDPPLEASQTRVPHIPDQTEFIERWFEFHQGYRIVKLPDGDGAENRIAVIGESFGEVSPGFLPRTVDELRAGRANDASRPENRSRRRRLSEEGPSEEGPQQSIEDALDSLLAEISDSEEQQPRELESDMPRRVSDVLADEATGRSRSPNRTEIHLQRARERLVRVFGTREDVQRDDYESPLSTMYNRAMNRYQQAEELRESGETTAPSTEGLSNRERREIEEQILWGVMNESRSTLDHRHQSGNIRSYTPAPLNRRRENAAVVSSTSEPRLFLNSLNGPQSSSSPSRRDSIPADQTSISHGQSPPFDLHASLSRLQADISRLRDATVASLPSDTAFMPLPHRSSSPPLTLDQPDRPPALSDAQMTRNMACQVCYSQLVDTVVLPCGHLVMCGWCADVVVPLRSSGGGGVGHLPARPSRCPMCRKGVKQRYRVHVGS